MDEQQTSFDAAMKAAERSHLLTIGSPARGLAFRVTIGRLDGRGRFHRLQPCAFWIWNGIRYDVSELRLRAAESFWTGLARRLPSKLAYFAAIRVAVNATVGEHGDQEVPALTMMEALQRWR
jgi:hypothetical protein